MNIIVAKNAGFCFGVEKAVEEVSRRLEAAEATDVFTYGEIVHNESVVEDFAKKGVRVINTPEEAEEAATESRGKNRRACVLIRAHGVGRAVYDRLEASGMQVVDATCPFVKRIHEIVQKAGEAGQAVVVVGDAAHPEVQGIVGWAKGDVFVAGTKEEALALELPKDREITIVCQTTFQRNKLKEIVEIFGNREYNVHIADTICNATGVRQKEAEEIASKADLMIVVGGANSSNTRKLYEISREKCADTCLVQHAGDLKGVRLKDAETIGITAGASTPKNMIEEVLLYVRTGTGSVV